MDADLHEELGLDATEQVVLHVTTSDETRLNDTPAEYAVVTSASDKFPGGCMVYGKYHGRWIANPNLRNLVKILFERNHR